jgi:transmembrane sensor
MSLEEEENVDKILSSIFFKEESFRKKEEIGNLLARERERERMKLNHRRRIIQSVCWGIAASITVLVVVWSLFNSEVVIETDRQKTLVSLPDNSSVELMPNSALHYNSLKWYFSRDLYLTGSASFAVAQGKTFTVYTWVGVISVLGTKFEVLQKENKMRVICMEGSVKIQTSSDNKILQAGESADCTPTDITLVKQPQSMLDTSEDLKEAFGGTSVLCGMSYFPDVVIKE